MTTEVQDFINSCSQCVNFQPSKQFKIYKPIIAEGPFARFTADLWEIDQEMIKASGREYRYFLPCVDHFSKYKWTELRKNKEGSTIVQKLEYIFNYFSPPKCFQTDNGKEFENSLVIDLCNRKKIKFVHGAPYYPQSQGVVEKINDLLSKSLYVSFHAYNSLKERPKYWDIEASLKAWTSNSNKNVHSVTRKIPNLLIHTTDSKEIQEVKSNIRNYYEKKVRKKISDLDLRIGTKVCFIKEIQNVKNKKKAKNPNQNNKNSLKKKGRRTKLRIPAEVVDLSNLQYSRVKIKICGKPTEDIQLNQVFTVALINLEEVKSEKAWNTLVMG